MQRPAGALFGNLALLIFTFAWLPLAQAEGLKWRQYYSVYKLDSSEVGDATDHILGVGKLGGLIILEGGKMGTVQATFSVDYTRGIGPHLFYAVNRTEDGSGFLVYGQGTTTISQDTNASVFTGSFTFVVGTGRFAGITGVGSYSGKRLAPISAGASGYIDFEGTFSVR
jgi:hypothetical protein